MFALYLVFSTWRKVKLYRVGNWNTYTFVSWNSKKSCKDLGAPSCMKSMHKVTKDLWMYTCGIHLRTKSKQKYSIVFRKLNRKNGVYSILCGRKRQKMALFLLRSVYLEVFGVAIDYEKKLLYQKKKRLVRFVLIYKNP